MNKYQEAVELLKEYQIGEELSVVSKVNYNARLAKIIDLFQELVDRATRKKVHKWLSDGSMACCPCCNNAEYVSNVPRFCEYCGQALDWTNESEQIAKGETK